MSGEHCEQVGACAVGDVVVGGDGGDVDDRARSLELFDRDVGEADVSDHPLVRVAR
jgi:hypothetical protein